jgi:hypothetical protein
MKSSKPAKAPANKPKNIATIDTVAPAASSKHHLGRTGKDCWSFGSNWYDGARSKSDVLFLGLSLRPTTDGHLCTGNGGCID